MSVLDASKYDTDKGPAYLKHYAARFERFRTRPINLLELGVFRGGSLLMWRDYFSLGQIFGIDRSPPPLPATSRIHLFEGDSTNEETYRRVEESTGCGEFDIIIDDASHIGLYTKQAFDHLYLNRLKPGGLYVLEDWGTCYRPDWPDGARAEIKPPQQVDGIRYRFGSHEFGMVGFLKQLVDAVGRADAVAHGGEVPAFPIDEITIAPGLAFITKSIESY
jgi:SAM-dependent methyltransferase